MSIAAAFAADKVPAFKAPAPAELPHRQTSAPLTVAVDSYVAGDKLKPAFGKLIPMQYGVLPVLVVIQNDGDKTIRLERLKVEYISRQERVEATPPRDVRYARAPIRPGVVNLPTGPIGVKTKKNPLDAWEIEGRAFAAKMLPPHQTASGFFYFMADPAIGATIYLSGLSEAESGKELLYFEIPL